jgi:hypothetical protein
MESLGITWRAVDSQGELTSIASAMPVLAELRTADPNSWGLFELPNGAGIKVGYANLGLKPQAILIDRRAIIGIDEVLACYDIEARREVFRYAMPSVFHEFLCTRDPLVVRDEIGFVCITLDGEERWAHYTTGPIEDFDITASRICGSTIDGDKFSFDL